MRTFASRHPALTMWIAASLLAGCGGAHTALPSTAAMSIAPNGYAAHDLVYNADYSEVGIFDYPRGKRVATLSGYNEVTAVCSDGHGNVWVINESAGGPSTLLEYAHAGSQPIATLNLSEHGADVCAVDPSTGNLAVGTSSAKVAIWKKARGSPAIYSTRQFVREVRTMTYDAAGNLYLRDFTGPKAAWLPKGGSAVELFEVAQRGAYAWDGSHLVVTGRASRYDLTLTLYKLHDANGKAVRHVLLDECNVYYARDYGPTLSIAGSAAAISCGLDETAVVYYYDYPAGGKPVKGLYGIAGSIAISVPSS